MDIKLMLTGKEIPVSYAYDYADREGFKELNKRLVPWFNIEGWRYTIEPLLSVEEALPLVGL